MSVDIIPIIISVILESHFIGREKNQCYVLELHMTKQFLPKDLTGFSLNHNITVII